MSVALYVVAAAFAGLSLWWQRQAAVSAKRAAEEAALANVLLERIAKTLERED